MSYAHVMNGTIDQEVGQPAELVRLDGKGVMLWSTYITPAELAACGWFQVVTTARPADTATQTTDRSLTVQAGKPTETWIVRSKTQAELDAARDAANDTSIRQQANTALDNNRTYLGLASPTNSQVVAQVRALTQQMNGVIRLVLGKLDGTN